MTALQDNGVTIFHNPACSKSRGAIEILQDRGIDFETIEYIKSPPSKDTLSMIISKLNGPVSELVRTTDSQFVALGLDAKNFVSEESVISLLIDHPELMQRPVVVKGDRAVIARPSERVGEVLD